jgi:hypothetical protein
MVKSQEHDTQVAFFRWVALNIHRHPGMKWIHAIPNGGHRDIRTAVRLKAEGVRSGIWDVEIPYPRCRDNEEYSGAYIEFKAGDNQLTKEQRAFEEYAFKYYDLCLAYDWITAARFTEKYLGLEKTV